MDHKDELAHRRWQRVAAQLEALGVSPGGVQKLFATGVRVDCLPYAAAMAKSVLEICGGDVYRARTVLDDIPTDGDGIFAAYDLEEPPPEPPIEQLVKIAGEIASHMTLPLPVPEPGEVLAAVIPLHLWRKGGGSKPPRK